MTNPACRIGRGGAADIAAFRIHNNQQASINGGAAKILQNLHSCRPVLLKKSGLRLDRGNGANRLFKAGHREIINCPDCSVACVAVLRRTKQRWNHADMGIYTHTERGASLAVCLG